MTGDLDSTLAAIDAAIGCQRCAGPLGDSPDRDFCGELCWTEWHAARVGAEVDTWGWGWSPPTWSDGGPQVEFNVTDGAPIPVIHDVFRRADSYLDNYMAMVLAHTVYSAPALRPVSPFVRITSC